MKQILKKAISILMVALIVCTIVAPCSVAAGEPVVARMYVITYLGGTSWTDHAFVYFENLSDKTLKVGLYDLPAGEGVSVGCYAASRADGYGIYYNVEAHCANKYGQSGWCSISEDLTESQLRKATDAIINARNGWDFIFNCMYFAFQVWNKTTGDNLVSLIFPFLGELQLKMRGGRSGPKMYFAREDQVFRQRGKGSSAYLTDVSRGTLDKAI